MPERDLQRELREIGAGLAFPPTPPLSAAVAAVLREERARGRRFVPPAPVLWSRRKVVVAIALAVLLIAGAAVAAKLGIGAISIEVVPTFASPAPTPSETGTVLGRPSSLSAARAALDFPIVAPASLGAPDAVFLDKTPDGEAVVLAWRDRAGLPVIPELRWGALLLEVRGEAPFAAKQVLAEEIHPVRVNGSSGYWITGRHQFAIQIPGGTRELTVTGNVLLWQRGDTALRLETAIPRAQAVALAEQIGPA